MAADWGTCGYSSGVIRAIDAWVLLFQFPGKSRRVELGNMQTSAISIFSHTILFLGLVTIFLIVIGVHIIIG